MARGNSPSLSPVAVAAVLGAAVVIFGAIGAIRIQALREAAPTPAPRFTPLQVPLWVEPERVVHRPPVGLSFDPPEVLEAFRAEEGLDQVVAGASGVEDALRRLMQWTRSLFEPARPDPYPPPDARVILRDIRGGFTGGFCAQYCFILVQAAGSFEIPARLVTIDGHEVVEAWLADQQRWVMLDPTYSIQVADPTGRTLSALEVRRALEHGRPLHLSEGHSYPGSEAQYLDRYRRFAVWVRNDFISQPMNFRDFDRYRVYFDPPESARLPSQSRTTTDPEELYPAMP